MSKLGYFLVGVLTGVAGLAGAAALHNPLTSSDEDSFRALDTDGAAEPAAEDTVAAVADDTATQPA